jgi:hypothetical protein
VGPYGRGSFDTLSVYAMGEGSEGCWKDYFLLRQKLIEQLIREGIARTDGNGKMKQNELALNIAIFHCQQLFTIDKDDSYYSQVVGLIPRKETLMNLYLFTGRYKELYDICCFYVRKGEHTIHTPYRQGLNDLLGTEDISKSFFDGNMRQIHHASFPAVALNHMYLLKQMMHEIMKVLSRADKQFLSSHDCVQAIGEFLGLDREWISYEGGSYNNQALEIMQLFVGCKTTEAEFGKLHGHSELFFNSGDFQQIKQLAHTANISSPICSVNSSGAWDMQSNAKSWEETLDCYIKDHSRFVDIVVPCLDIAVDKLNDTVGYGALNVNMIDERVVRGHRKESRCPEFVLTRFVSDAMEICQQNFLEFYNFINFVDDYDGLDYEDVDDPFDFGYTILAALMIERKIAQGFYYLSLSTGMADSVLEKLPAGSRFRRTRPPPMSPSERMSLRPWGEDGLLDCTDRIKSISRYLPDVTDVIEALFNADLATNENLTVLFGHSSLVWSTVLDLQMAKRNVNQMKLTDFWAKKRKRII